MIIKRDFIYTPKNKKRPIHIYLPDNYYETEERYPVMYFFDGHNLFYDEDATYGKSWGLKTFLDQWSKPMIIVGMECGHEGVERLCEYSPYFVTFSNPDHERCMGEETFRWIIEEIKPIIDREYRTYPFRECTGIGGSSMGGLMELYGAVCHNQWFSKAACLSSAIGFCMQPLMKDLENSEINPDTRIYLSWGTKEAGSHTYDCNVKVAEKVQEKGGNVKIDCQVGGGHCEADWEKLVPEFMRYLWGTK